MRKEFVTEKEVTTVEELFEEIENIEKMSESKKLFCDVGSPLEGKEIKLYVCSRKGVDRGLRHLVTIKR